MTSADPALDSIHALPARFRQRLSRRLSGVAVATQAVEWCCLGIPPALLARNPHPLHAWHALTLLVAAFLGVAGVSATLATLCPPATLNARSLLRGCAVASGSAFALVLHPSPLFTVLAVTIGSAALGWSQVQAATLRAWLADTSPPDSLALWSWGPPLGDASLRDC